MRPGARAPWIGFAVALMASATACASASDVRERSAALAPTLDPTARGANGHCPARELAFAAAELAFAQAAADRADPGAAARHLCAAEWWASNARAKTRACVAVAPPPPEPPEPPDATSPTAPGESP